MALNGDKKKEIIEAIEKLIKLYNIGSADDKLTLSHIKESELKNTEESQDKKKDVSNIFVCVYNDKCVGLFTKIGWIGKNRGFVTCYDAGSIYIGVDSNYIGMKQTHHDISILRQWLPSGTKETVDGKNYAANCDMQNAMSFDDMRLIMYKKGMIDSYELGKATNKEMLDVLAFAHTYFKLDEDMVHKAKFIKKP